VAVVKHLAMERREEEIIEHYPEIEVRWNLEFGLDRSNG
jgi:hypothetical protein